MRICVTVLMTDGVVLTVDFLSRGIINTQTISTLSKGIIIAHPAGNA